MGEKKHIDRLFQEKFKNFEVSPDPQIWERIEEQLDQEKSDKKRVIVPFWLQYASIAALVLLMIVVSYNVISTKQETPVADDDLLVKEDTSIKESKFKNEEENVFPIEMDHQGLSNTVDVVKGNNSNSLQDNSKSEILIANDVLVQYENNLKKGDQLDSERRNGNESKKYQEGLSISDTEKSNSGIAESNNVIASFVDDTLSGNKGIHLSNKINAIWSHQEGLCLLPGATIVIDSLMLEQFKPSIDEALAVEENLNEEKQNLGNKKWSVNSNIAPVYYSSLSQGSPIDERFASNSKEGTFNMSYGVAVNYAVNKKLKLRSGVNRVELGYITENIAIVPIEEGRSNINSYKNINISSSAKNFNMSNINLTFINPEVPNSFKEMLDADINQQFDYIEVPLEVSYQLLSKRIGLNVIAGMSSFFLSKNEIYAETSSQQIYIGESNNLNTTVFSTNIGVGVNYNFTNRLSFSLEPMFKYQLNSFSSNSGNFNPYILGVYSGLNFKF